MDIRINSFDRLLQWVVLIVPCAMFIALSIKNNPYIDFTTALIVSGMSILLFAAIRINQRLRIPILSMFILIYVGHWHLRYLTLMLWPEYQHVLTRTVLVDQEIFNEYSLLVLFSIVAVFFGIFLAYHFMNATKGWSVNNTKSCFVGVGQLVSSRKVPVALYCLAALSWHFVSLNCLSETVSRVDGYISWLFMPPILIFLCLAVLAADNISKNIKLLFGSYLIVHLLLTIVGGSRTGALYMFICLMGVLYIYEREIKLNLRRWISIAIVIMIAASSYYVATSIRTYQKYMCGSGTNLVLNLIASGTPSLDGDWTPSAALSSIGGNIPIAGGILGQAVARAGYLDIGAEMYANDEYANIINISNLAKSTIDNLIPGHIYEEGKVSHRIKNIYGNSENYGSDAISAVGENYLLFGNYFLIAITFVTFVFTLAYSLSGSTLVGFWMKFVLLMHLGIWWNSFGYDWLIQSIALQAVLGSLIIVLICSKRVPR